MRVAASCFKCKRVTLFTIIALLVLSPVISFGQTGLITIDNVEGMIAPNTVAAGQQLTFNFRLEVTMSELLRASANGFRVYSPSGAVWDTTYGEFTGAITTSMMDLQFVSPYSLDGIGADTIGFGGVAMFSPGIPSGFNEVVWSVTIGPIDIGYDGGIICIDSSYYPPVNDWEWASSGDRLFPDWGGPYCYTIAKLTPVVENSIPASDEHNVPTKTNIVAEFDVPMNPTTFNNSTFIVTSSISGIKSGTYSYEDIGNRAIFDPEIDFIIGENVYVELSTDIQTVGGKPLNGIYSWSFVIADIPPNIINISPASNSTNVNPETSVIFYFDQDMDETSFSESLISAIGTVSGLHDGSFTYDSSSRALQFDLYDDFADGEKVDIIVEPSAYAVVGSKMVRGVVARFTIAVENGVGKFNRMTTFATDDSPFKVITADFNNDSYADIATLNAGNSISVLLNNGLGNFISLDNYPIDPNPGGFAVSDINRDGYLDLVTTSKDNDNLIILFNNGLGGFGDYQYHPAGNYPVDVAVGDLNSDGQDDFAVLSLTDDALTILLSTPSGPYILQTEPTANGPIDVEIADFNNDMLNDIALVCPESSRLEVFLNYGNNTYDDSLYNVDYSPFSLEVNDFDGDGFADIAVTSVFFYNDKVTIFPNDGDGAFYPDSPYSVSLEPNSIVSADFDSDSDLDLATANTSLMTVEFLQNIGESNFELNVNHKYDLGYDCTDIAVADFNGDGTLDLVTSNRHHDNISILFNQLFYCGDVNNERDGPDISDLTYLISYLFHNGPQPVHLGAADLDVGGTIDITDLTLMVDYLFRTGFINPECF